MEPGAGSAPGIAGKGHGIEGQSDGGVVTGGSTDKKAAPLLIAGLLQISQPTIQAVFAGTE